MKSLWIALFTACIIVACASKPKPESKAVGQSTLIGMVEMVNPEQNYVLIRCDQVLSLESGTEVTALRADGRKAKLVLTPERKGYYLTADIKDGQPAVSDLVLIQTGSLPSSAATATVPTVPSVQPTPSASPGSYTMPVLPQIPLTLPTVSPAPSGMPAKTPEPTINLQELEPVLE